MGGDQSKPSASRKNSKLLFEDSEKREFFTILFNRLLEKGDIVDIKALTSGPGACGNYVVLLSKNIEKEFKYLHLSNKNADLTYSPTKKITSKSSSKESACTQLALFYIRTLQLVAAVTMSLYYPPDILYRITTEHYNKDLALEKRLHPIIESEIEIQRKKRARDFWLSRFLKEIRNQTQNFLFNNDTQLTYNNLTSMLTFITDESVKYNLILTVLEPDTYSVSPALIKPDTYWIVLTNDYISENKSVIYTFRILVNANGFGWIFTPTPSVPPTPTNGSKPKTIDVEKVLDAEIHIDEWIQTMKAYIISFASAQKNTTFLPRMVPAFGNVKPAVNTRKNNFKKNTKTFKNTNTFKMASNSTIPPRDRESYTSMLKWLETINMTEWPEAAPAIYRATLLYKKPTINSDTGTSYICGDIWENTFLNKVYPFAALESLYYDNEKGIIDKDDKNRALLSELSKEFFDIYKGVYEANAMYDTNVNKFSIPSRESVTEFRHLKIPDITFLRKYMCNNSSPQGEIQLNRNISNILRLAEKTIVEEYKKHISNMYDVITSIFETAIEGGETIIKFKEDFTGSSKGMREELETQLEYVRDLIKEHYKMVEKTYYTAIIEIANVYRVGV
jgi:hypothetical protein